MAEPTSGARSTRAATTKQAAAKKAAPAKKAAAPAAPPSPPPATPAAVERATREAPLSASGSTWSLAYKVTAVVLVLAAFVLLLRMAGQERGGPAHDELSIG